MSRSDPSLTYYCEHVALATAFRRVQCCSMRPGPSARGSEELRRCERPGHPRVVAYHRVPFFCLVGGGSHARKTASAPDPAVELNAVGLSGFEAYIQVHGLRLPEESLTILRIPNFATQDKAINLPPPGSFFKFLWVELFARIFFAFVFFIPLANKHLRDHST